MSNLFSTGGAGNVGASGITQQSLKFNDDESQYLSWTPASAGNRRTWTWSGWVKRGNVNTSDNQTLFSASGGSAEDMIRFIGSGGGADHNKISFYIYDGGYVAGSFTTSQVFRDPSAWYHIVWVWDSSNATSTDRIRLYVNGERITAFDASLYPSLNADCGGINNSYQHEIGRQTNSTARLFDGYMSDINFIDGQALDASSFGQFTNGYWEKKDYAGSYGTNGFHLTFQDDVVSEGFNTVTYRGTGATQNISGLGFSPDLLWAKPRSAAYDHSIANTVVGITEYMNTNTTAAEGTASSIFSSADADGFTLGTSGNVNQSGQTYVAWCWDAGSGSPVSNTDGSITSTVKANPSYGFSIVSYTGDGSSSATVGHGLAVAPSMLIVKRRDVSGYGWNVYHSAIGASNLLFLSSTDAAASSSIWNSTAPTSSVFNLGTSSGANGSGGTYIAYCFAEVAGYSSIGSYEGDGTTNGSNVVTLGFKPAFVMIKNVDDVAGWHMFDNTRDTVSPISKYLTADTSDVESTLDLIEFTSTGFAPIFNGNAVNHIGETYIYMAFADTREAAFWKDVSGQGNHWTPNNLDYRDSLIDSPANNFATFNPLDALGNANTFSEGNLKYVVALQSAAEESRASFGVSSGKWYWEHKLISSTTTGGYFKVGIKSDDGTNYWNVRGSDGETDHNGSNTIVSVSYTTGDVVGVILDMDAGKWYISVNGTLQNSANIGAGTGFIHSGITGTVLPYILNASSGGTHTGVANFGQDSTFSGNRPAGGNTDANGIGDFAYAPPSGYLALCTANLPTPTIIDGSEHFNTVLYVGDYTTSNSITGVGFSPDFVWVKDRGLTTAYNYSHALFDNVRGAGKWISSNRTDAENDFGTGTTSPFRSFDADGFTVGQNYNTNEVDPVAEYFVSWNWKAGGTAVSNTAGSITSQVSANTDAGFSVVSWTSTNGVATIGHGLGSPPDVIFVKDRDTAVNWTVYHKSVGNTGGLILNSTSAFGSNVNYWNNTSPTSSVFTVGSFSNYLTDAHIAYCFADSDIIKAGSYTGNGSADGPFVYTGFRPAWVMIKNISTTSSWVMYDNQRDSFNAVGRVLYANSSNAENDTRPRADLLSNGFKLRNASEPNWSGNTIIYLAFAEHPFKYANAR